MSTGCAGKQRWTRRGLLQAVPLAALASRRTVPDERRRYPDPATEFEVVRLTDPAHPSYLPSTYNQIFSRRDRFLLYGSRREDGLQAYAMDLRNGASQQLTSAGSLDLSSLTLTPDERNLCYLDQGTLMMIAVRGTTPRPVYRIASGSEPGSGMSVTADGPSALLIEQGNRLRLVHLAKGSATPLAEAAEPIRDPMPRPRRASVLYQGQSGTLYLAHLDGSRTLRLKTAEGKVGAARWSPDGRTVLYLNHPAEQGRATSLREINPDTGEDKLIAVTTQFVQFSPNSDASVFVGASASRASPYVLILLRAARREMALCEHKSEDSSSVSPVFSPDSQRIYFQSDRHGAPALYSMQVEKLVEKTES